MLCMLTFPVVPTVRYGPQIIQLQGEKTQPYHMVTDY